MLGHPAIPWSWASRDLDIPGPGCTKLPGHTLVPGYALGLREFVWVVLVEERRSSRRVAAPQGAKERRSHPRGQSDSQFWVGLMAGF